MKVIVPGHIYDLHPFGSSPVQRLAFLRRSSGAVHYESEWDGLQTQEVLRALINRSVFLNDIIPCPETERATQYLRLALFEYEARAYRRRSQKLNRLAPAHNSGLPVPFDERGIEGWPTGPDGHIDMVGQVTS